MWASGQVPFADDGKGRSGLSGVHPFVMFQGKESRRYVGIFFRNSAAMTPVLKFNESDGTSILSFITIGGDIDMYVFIKGTAKEVM
jgi:alpha-glucosidase (family GH31 glycosyl hydrolase)